MDKITLIGAERAMNFHWPRVGRRHWPVQLGVCANLSGIPMFR